MRLQIKKLSETAILPSQVHEGDAGLDLYVDRAELERLPAMRLVEGEYNKYDKVVYERILVHFGVAVAIPPGHVGLIFVRSSISKTPYVLANSVGVIDSGYRGELMGRFRWTEGGASELPQAGSRMAQLLVLPLSGVTAEEVSEFTSAATVRGTGGFGSTGN